MNPYNVTDWADGPCDYCAEGAEFDLDVARHRHLMFVSREGASTRTADDLANVLMYDALDVLEGYPGDRSALLTEADYWRDLLDTRRSPWGSAWLDPELGDPEIHDAIGPYEAALSEFGFLVEWSDGFTIERIEEMTA